MTSRWITPDRRPEFVLESVRGRRVWSRRGVGASVWRRLWRSSDSRRTARRVAAASWRSMSSMWPCAAFALPRALFFQPAAAVSKTTGGGCEPRRLYVRGVLFVCGTSC